MSDVIETLPKPTDALEYLLHRVAPAQSEDASNNIRKAIKSVRAALEEAEPVVVHDGEPVPLGVHCDHCGAFTPVAQSLIDTLASKPSTAEPYCKDCNWAGMIHCSDPQNCGNIPPKGCAPSTAEYDKACAAVQGTVNGLKVGRANAEHEAKVSTAEAQARALENMAETFRKEHERGKGFTHGTVFSVAAGMCELEAKRIREEGK